MDLVINALDDHLLDPYVYGASPPAWLMRHHVVRDSITLWVTYSVGALLLYFIFAAANYYFVYGRMCNLAHDPFKGQMQQEIAMSVRAILLMPGLQIPVTLAEIHGYARLYGPGEKWGWADYGTLYGVVTIVWFLVFTDTLIYWIHRALHHGALYKRLHKPHHLWKSPTPFASHAFHPVDGWSQGMAYHIYVFLFPMHKVLHLAMFVMVNMWTISIHDGVSAKPWWFVNGTAHHTYHHSDFNYNYGQFFVFWDWLCGTMRDPFAKGRLLDPEVQQEIRNGTFRPKKGSGSAKSKARQNKPQPNGAAAAAANTSTNGELRKRAH